MGPSGSAETGLRVLLAVPTWAATLEAIPPTPPRILIVDDDESVRDVISVLLREEGYHCAVASGADMALELAQQEDTPLVISDMKMPGKDGLWLLEAFREFHYPNDIGPGVYDIRIHRGNGGQNVVEFRIAHVGVDLRAVLYRAGGNAKGTH